MLKVTSVVGPTASVEVGDEEQDGKRIQVEDWDEKEPVQQSHKGQPKSQKTAKSKKWIQAKNTEASRAKNLSS